MEIGFIQAVAMGMLFSLMYSVILMFMNVE